MRTQPAYDRLVAANPIPDVEPYLDAPGAVDVDRRIEAVVARPGPIFPSPRATARPALAVAAFLAVVVVAAAVSLIAGLGGRAPVGDAPVDVVNAFFDRWNEGDVEGALELVDPEASINVGFNSVAELRGLMEYAAEWDATMETDCRPAEIPGSVVCDWSWTAASAAVLGLDGGNVRRFQVSDRRITALATPSYGAHESAMASYAESVDPEGFAIACDPVGAPSVSAYGFAFNAECGRFMAGLEDSFVEGLGSRP